MLPLFLLVLAFAPMLFETMLSARHERILRAMGATEPPRDVYRLMLLAYPSSFVAMAAEAWLSDRRASPVMWTGAAVFVAAKALKYWAVATLGTRWTFKVLVPPGSSHIRTGPYALLAHPNYVAVVGELAGMALLAQAPATGAVSIIVFAALIVARIRIEERALGVR